MKCPRCKSPTVVHEPTPGKQVPVCEACGWGRQRLEAIASGGAPESPTVTGGTLVKLGGLWVISLLVVFGPFVGLWLAADRWMAREPLVAEMAEPFKARLLIHYWWVMALYLLIALAVTPSYDRENMGIFGPGYAGNIALTREQHANRAMHSLSGLLLPGKVVWATVRATWQVGRALLGRPA